MAKRIAGKVQKRNWSRDIGVTLMLFALVFGLVFPGVMYYRLQRVGSFKEVVADVASAAEKCAMAYKSGKRSYITSDVIECTEVDAFKAANPEQTWRTTRQVYLTLAFDWDGGRREALLPETKLADGAGVVGSKLAVFINPEDAGDLETRPETRDWVYTIGITLAALAGLLSGLLLFRRGLRQGG